MAREAEGRNDSTTKTCTFKHSLLRSLPRGLERERRGLAVQKSDHSLLACMRLGACERSAVQTLTETVRGCPLARGQYVSKVFMTAVFTLFQILPFPTHEATHIHIDLPCTFLGFQKIKLSVKAQAFDFRSSISLNTQHVGRHERRLFGMIPASAPRPREHQVGRQVLRAVTSTVLSPPESVAPSRISGRRSSSPSNRCT